MKSLYLYSLVTVALLSFFLPIVADAQPISSPDPRGLSAGFTRVLNFRQRAGIRNFGTPEDFVFQTLRLVLSFLAIVAIIVIIIGGIMYIVAVGDEKKTERAKHTILYAILGLVIIGVAGIVVNIVIGLFFTA